jgi:hypothetical protein
MARTASLTSVSLFSEVGHGSNFTIELDPSPEAKRIRCRIVEWPEGQLELIEKRLSSFRMPVVHQGEQSYF